MLYLEPPKTAGPSALYRLMRIPVSGGVPQFVLVTPIPINYGCARAPASLCVLIERSQDERQLTLTAFDPLKGRGKMLRSIEKDPSAFDYGAEVSPDGSTVAISKPGEAEIHIRLLSASGGSDREITVKGWPNMTGLDWSPDGKGILLRVCLGVCLAPSQSWFLPSERGQGRPSLCGSEGECPGTVALQSSGRSDLGHTFTGRSLPRHTRRRHQQQRVDA
jgi:hypothetical protein